MANSISLETLFALAEKKKALEAASSDLKHQHESLLNDMVKQISDDQIFEFMREREKLNLRPTDEVAKIIEADYLLREQLKLRAKEKLAKANNIFDYANAIKFCEKIKGLSPTVYREIKTELYDKIEKPNFSKLIDNPRLAAHPKKLRKTLSGLQKIDLPEEIKELINQKLSNLPKKSWLFGWKLPVFAIPEKPTHRTAEINKLLDACDSTPEFQKIKQLLETLKNLRSATDPDFLGKVRRNVGGRNYVDNTIRKMREILSEMEKDPSARVKDIVRYCRNSIQQRIDKVESRNDLKEILKINFPEVQPDYVKVPEEVSQEKSTAEQELPLLSIEKEIGKGSFGAVSSGWVGVDIPGVAKKGDRVAIKMVNEKATDKDREAFEEECEISTNLHMAHGASEDDSVMRGIKVKWGNQDVLVMKYYPYSLEELANTIGEVLGRNSPPIPPREVNESELSNEEKEKYREAVDQHKFAQAIWDDPDIFINQLLSSLERSEKFCHDNDVFHGDIAQRNARAELRRDNESGEFVGFHAVFGDFGFAKKAGTERAVKISPKGPIKWMDVLSLRDNIMTHRRDLYALQITMFECLHEILGGKIATLVEVSIEENKIWHVQDMGDDANALGKYFEELMGGLKEKFQKNPRLLILKGLIEKTYQDFLRIGYNGEHSNQDVLKSEEHDAHSRYMASQLIFFADAVEARLKKCDANNPESRKKLLLSIKRILNTPSFQEFNNNMLYKKLLEYQHTVDLSAYEVNKIKAFYNAYEMFKDVADEVVKSAFIKKYSEMMVVGNNLSVSPEQIALINNIIGFDYSLNISDKCKALEENNLILPDHFPAVLKAISLSEPSNLAEKGEQFEKGVQKILLTIEDASPEEIARGIKFKSTLQAFEDFLKGYIKGFEDAVKIMDSLGKDIAPHEESIRMMKVLLNKMSVAHQQLEEKLSIIIKRVDQRIQHANGSVAVSKSQEQEQIKADDVLDPTSKSLTRDDKRPNSTLR